MDLEVTFSTDGGFATFDHIDFVVLKETDGTFLFGSGGAVVFTFEAGSEFAISDEASYGSIIPRAAFCDGICVFLGVVLCMCIIYINQRGGEPKF